jgi:hypothetical protein
MCEKTHLEPREQVAAKAPAPSPKIERVWTPTMDTVLFTDHGIVVLAITSAAAALLLSALGLATTYRIRSDMKDQFRLEGAEQRAATSEADTSRDAEPNEWASLRDEFNAMMRDGVDSIEDMLDEQFRRRFGELMYRTARARRRESLAA